MRVTVHMHAQATLVEHGSSLSMVPWVMGNDSCSQSIASTVWWATLNGTQGKAQRAACSMGVGKGHDLACQHMWLQRHMSVHSAREGVGLTCRLVHEAFGAAWPKFAIKEGAWVLAATVWVHGSRALLQLQQIPPLTAQPAMV